MALDVHYDVLEALGSCNIRNHGFVRSLRGTIL